MEIVLYVIICILVIIGTNLYKIKRITRRIKIKQMTVDANTVNLIKELKKVAKNNSSLKKNHNKLILISIIKYFIYIFFALGLVVPFTFIIYKLIVKGEMPQINTTYTILSAYPIALLVSLGMILILKKYRAKIYTEYKLLLKKSIYNEFFKRINPEIRWHNEIQFGNREELENSNILINLNTEYKTASFNKIESDINEYGIDTDHFKEFYFEDNISGIYKDKYQISASDYKEIWNLHKFIYSRSYLINEGIFATIKIDKTIDNDIKIMSNKKYELLIDKQFLVTSMTDTDYKNFAIFAKNKYKISEMISKRTIELMEEFYNNSRINFKISIKKNEIFFEFKTIDTLEPYIGKNVIDELMLKEYANILNFITELGEEINTNWKTDKSAN